MRDIISSALTSLHGTLLAGKIRDYNNQQAGDGYARNLCFVLRAADGSIVGGVIAETHWNWLFR